MGVAKAPEIMLAQITEKIELDSFIELVVDLEARAVAVKLIGTPPPSCLWADMTGSSMCHQLVAPRKSL